MNHLQHIRAKRAPGSKGCLRRFESFVRDELWFIQRFPKFRWRRHTIPHNSVANLRTVRCLGVAEDPSSTAQRNVGVWEKRSNATTYWYSFANTTRWLDNATRLEKADVPNSPREALALAERRDVSAVAPAAHPLLHTLHGGVSPARLVDHSRFLGRLLGVLPTVDALSAITPRNISSRGAVVEPRTAAAIPPDTQKSSPPPDIVRLSIAELGAGNAGLLYPLCPPNPAVRCFGSDYARRLVDEATAAFRFGGNPLEMAHACFMPHVAAGTVDAVISNGVVILLSADQVCRHVAEALRILKPGGRAVVWMIKRKWQGTRYHWSFFVNASVWPDEGPADLGADGEFTWERGVSDFAADVLPVCTGGLGALVSRVDVYTDGPTNATLYGGSRDVFFGIRLTRSTAPWPHTDPAATPRPPPSNGEGDGRPVGEDLPAPNNGWNSLSANSPDLSFDTVSAPLDEDKLRWYSDVLLSASRITRGRSNSKPKTTRAPKRRDKSWPLQRGA